MTDPGFPRGSDNPKEEGGCQPIIQQNVPENCTKLNTIWKFGLASNISKCKSVTGFSGRGEAPSAMDQNIFDFMEFFWGGTLAKYRVRIPTGWIPLHHWIRHH